MRRLLIIILLIAGMFYLGWLSFRNDDGTSTIQLNKDEVKADADKAIEKTKEVLHEGADAVKQAVDSSSSTR
ncbi:MAG: hypothetical protein KF708_14770 [Pirellulales bacterium]|nr:hypothetical protein [Pirellulales bacterium]